MVLPLCNIKPGDTVRIVFLANEGAMAGRLRDLGFDSGAVISCVMQRPKKNIAAYLVRNAVIALREEDSRLIFVRAEEPGAEAGGTDGASVRIVARTATEAAT